MGEAARVAQFGPAARAMRPAQQQQIQVDMKNAVPKICECGCELFTAAFKVSTISGLCNPTGQDLTAQQPVLVCMDCKKVL